MKTYRLFEITTRDGLRRRDGRYPQRIGSLVQIEEAYLTEGIPLALEYIEDGKGNPKQGVLTTSPIVNIGHDVLRSQIGVTTRNSVYHLREIDEQEAHNEQD